jgi:hypothetical protein
MVLTWGPRSNLRHHMYSAKLPQIRFFSSINITSRTQRLSCAIGKFPKMPILNNFIYHHIAHVHFPVHFHVAGCAGGWLMEQPRRIEISGNGLVQAVQDFWIEYVHIFTNIWICVIFSMPNIRRFLSEQTSPDAPPNTSLAFQCRLLPPGRGSIPHFYCHRSTHYIVHCVGDVIMPARSE